MPMGCPELYRRGFLRKAMGLGFCDLVRHTSPPPRGKIIWLDYRNSYGILLLYAGDVSEMWRVTSHLGMPTEGAAQDCGARVYWTGSATPRRKEAEQGWADVRS